MSNSSLVDCTILSPNHSGKRTHAIDRLTPHCVVGQITAEKIGEIFLPTKKQASCNYGIGKDGRVCLVVDEANRSWCSSSSANDQRAITFECASDSCAPYAFNAVVYDKLVKLCVDICKRYNKDTLLWIEDKNKALAYNPKSNEMLLTVHRWFANKSCPGDWMYSRMGQLAETVTSQLRKATTTSASGSDYIYKGVDYKYVFEPNYYSNKYSDLKAAFGTNAQKLFKHFCEFGMKEGRQAIASFNVQKYKTKYKDLQKEFGDNLPKYYEHYCVYGHKEGRTAGSGTASPASSTKIPYTVQITANVLNIRKGPGTNYAKTGTITDKGKYIIVKEKNGWGLLKNKAGWISLKYTKKI